MNFTFDRPFAVVFALVFLLAVFFARRRRRPAWFLRLNLGPPDGASFVPPSGASFLNAASVASEIAALTLLLLALASPRLSHTDYVRTGRGSDVIFVLDDSPSMAGSDMGGDAAPTARSRFDTAKNLITAFAASRPGDAVGLVAVGDDAALLVPPTADRAALDARLASLTIGELGDGTALGNGLSVAALHLRREKERNCAVVLITDGENNAGNIHPETAAEAVAAAGASLYVIGVGSQGMISFDYTDLGGTRRRGTFLSHYDVSALRSIAAAGGGVFYSAPEAASFADAFRRVNENEIYVGRSIPRRRVRDLTVPFIIAALAAALASRFVRNLLLGAYL